MKETLACAYMKLIEEDLNLLMKPSILKEILPPTEKRKIKQIKKEMGVNGDIEYEYNNQLLKQAEAVIALIVKNCFPALLFKPIPVYIKYMGSPNAFVIYIRDDDSYALGFDPMFISLLSQILMQVVVFDKALFDLKSNSMPKETISEEANLLSQMIKNTYYRWRGIFVPDDDYWAMFRSINKRFPGEQKKFYKFITLFGYASKGFILAHELGHIVLQHFSSSDRIPFVPFVHDKVEISTFRHEREYEADQWAFSSLVSLESNEIKLFWAEVYCLFLSLLSVIESFHRPETELARHISDSHPPVKQRLYRLRRLTAAIPDYHPEDLIAEQILHISRYSFWLDIISDVYEAEHQVPAAPDTGPKPVKPKSKPAKTVEPAAQTDVPPAFTNQVGMTFVLIPAGTFRMGSPAGEKDRFDNERPYQVTLSRAFYLQTTPVTQGQWQSVMGGNPAHFKDGGDNCPVDSVSWNDAQAFITKLNRMEKTDTYRLPTEAEWEYACRAGSNTRFCFGGAETQLKDYAWYVKNSKDKTHPGGQKKPNAWGLYDMHGNVLEWCQDWYGEYPAGPVLDPQGPDTGEERVLRGGSWCGDSRFLRAAYRGRIKPDFRSDMSLGFRVARTF